MPPEDDDRSNEDSDDDGILYKGIVCQRSELQIYGREDELLDLTAIDLHKDTAALYLITLLQSHRQGLLSEPKEES
jgi:hypothetical protein